MSVVTYLELVFGASKSQQVEVNLAKIEQLRRLIPVATSPRRYDRHEASGQVPDSFRSRFDRCFLFSLEES
jgi:hypothetical protein